tara:strand:- start:1977 stop:2165 length:189 start_codon:yes stop_codon:yes gene_type:complete
MTAEMDLRHTNILKTMVKALLLLAFKFRQEPTQPNVAYRQLKYQKSSLWLNSMPLKCKMLLK